MPQLLAHGWWNLGGAKMSKSAGNIIDPFVLIDKYGADALRYYLMSDIARGKDADFSDQRLIERYNSDLANSLGNLLNRTLNMTQQYRHGSLKRPSDPTTLALTNTPVEFESAAAFFKSVVFGYSGSLEVFDIDASLDDAIMCAISCNGFIDSEKPWLLAKDVTQAGRLDGILYILCESLRIIAILISPVLPKAAHGIFDQLNWKMELSGKEERFSLADAEWGGLPDGHVVAKPVPLFPRIETVGSG